MEVIALTNRKGGIGKTTSVHALGAGLRRRGYRVCLIDLDGQRNLSFLTGADLSGEGPTIWDVLTGAAAAADAIQETAGGDIIPADGRLSGADQTFTGETNEEKRKALTILRDAIKPLQSEYDYIILDTPAAMGILTLQALTAAHSAIITGQAGVYTLQGLSNLYSSIQGIKATINKDLYIRGILLVLFNGRTNISRQIRDQISEAAAAIGTKVYDTAIRTCIAIEEAAYMQQDIFTYAPRSNAAADYNDFINEFLQDSK